MFGGAWQFNGWRLHPVPDALNARPALVPLRIAVSSVEVRADPHSYPSQERRRIISPNPATIAASNARAHSDSVGTGAAADGVMPVFTTCEIVGDVLVASFDHRRTLR